MGLFDMLGVGGGDVSVEVACPTVQEGGIVEGTATFTAGKRAQKIDRMVVKLECSVTTKRHDPEFGWQEETDTTDILPETPIASGFSAEQGFKQAFPFRFQLPAGAPTSVPDQVEYSLVASADIDGEVDPSARVELRVAPAGHGAASVRAAVPLQPRQLKWPSGCPQCGAPIQPPTDGALFLECPFCKQRVVAEQV